MTLDRATRLATGGVMLLAAASSWFGLRTALGGEEPLWIVVALEAVVLFAAVFGVAFMLGRFRDAPGLTILCLAGAVLLPAGLSPLAQGLTVRQVVTNPVFLARLAMVGGLAGLATIATLRSDRAAWRRLIMGGMMTAAATGLVAGGWMTKSRWLDQTTGGLKVALVIVSLVCVIILAGVVCVGIDRMISAFDGGSSRPSGEDASGPHPAAA